MRSVVLKSRFNLEDCSIEDLGIDIEIEILRTMPEWAVRERCFESEVMFRVGDLILDRPRVPVLDLALCLRFALDDVAVHGSSRVDFLGSPDKIMFTLIENDLSVRSSYANGSASCFYVEMVQAVALFLRDVLDAVTAISVYLLANPLIERLYRESGVREKGREQFLRHARFVDGQA